MYGSIFKYSYELLSDNVLRCRYWATAFRVYSTLFILYVLSVYRYCKLQPPSYIYILIDKWLGEDVKSHKICHKADCDSISGLNLYCDLRESHLFFYNRLVWLSSLDSCHVCHRSPSIVQFGNEQGFCALCELVINSLTSSTNSILRLHSCC